MSPRVFVSPQRYVQGPGILESAGKIMSYHAKNLFIMGGPHALKAVEESGLMHSLIEVGLKYRVEEFHGECTFDEINRLVGLAQENHPDTIVACGGGKSIDTGKAVAHSMDARCVIIPTICANDAPTSAVAGVYKRDHSFERGLDFPSNPNLVLVDTNVIARAPARYLACGMGDAMSKKFEGEACVTTGADTMSNITEHDKPTMAALTLCRLAHQALLDNGILAMDACRRRLATPELESAVEACILLSGLGFENCGLAAAHSIGVALGDQLREKMTPQQYHGELVHFGTLSQVVMEKRNVTEIKHLFEWSRKIGLPTNFTELGLGSVTQEDLWKVANEACSPAYWMHNMPFAVSPETVMTSMNTADRTGSELARDIPREPYEQHY